MKQKDKFSFKSIPGHVYGLCLIIFVLVLTGVPEALMKSAPSFSGEFAYRVVRSLKVLTGMDSDPHEVKSDEETSVDVKRQSHNDPSSDSSSDGKEATERTEVSDRLIEGVTMSSNLNLLGQLLLLGVQAHADGTTAPHPCAASGKAASILTAWSEGSFRSRELLEKAVADYLVCQGLEPECHPEDLKTTKYKSSVEFAIARILNRMLKAGIVGISAASPLRVSTEIYDAIVNFEHSTDAASKLEAAGQVCRSFEPFLNSNWTRLYATTSEPEASSRYTRRI